MEPSERNLLLDHVKNCSGTNKLSVIFAIICMVDVFGVFPVVALPKAIIDCGMCICNHLNETLNTFLRTLRRTGDNCSLFGPNLHRHFIGKMLDHSRKDRFVTRKKKQIPLFRSRRNYLRKKFIQFRVVPRRHDNFLRRNSKFDSR